MYSFYIHLPFYLYLADCVFIYDAGDPFIIAHYHVTYNIIITYSL